MSISTLWRADSMAAIPGSPAALAEHDAALTESCKTALAKTTGD